VSLAGADATMTASQDSGVSMRVLWTVSGYHLGNNATMSEAVAKTYLFKPLDIAETTIVFDGKQCSNVDFVRKNVDIREYLDNVWHVSAQELRIAEQTAQVFNTTCDMSLFREYIRLQDGRLLTRQEGVLFIFEPNVMR
jgi:hypothetical protein